MSRTAPAPAGRTTVLRADVLPGLELLHPRPAPSAAVLHIGVALQPRDPSGQASLERALYDPANPLYHRFLTPADFAARFGPSGAAYSAVRSWLRGGGLQVTLASSSGTWLQATGTVAQIERLMRVTIGAYESKGVSFLANEQAPTVPAGDSIVSVVGLNTLQRFSTPAKPSQPARSQTAQSAPGCLPGCYYGPQDLWSLYDQPASNEGQGTTMAVFGAGRTDDVVQNLRLFEKDFKLPQIPITVNHVGAGPFDDDSGQVEWDLDTQASTGMAPAALGETLYFAKGLADADVESIFTAWVDDPNGPAQANASFGECETDPANPIWNLEPPAVGQSFGDGDNLEPVAESTLRQATLEGRTLFAASGDTGSSCPLFVLPVIGAGNGFLNHVQPFADYPCASDYAVCVGGTVLWSDGNTPAQRSVEYAWPYTGGGSSAFIAEPEFQKDVANIDHPCLVDPSGGQYPDGTICRGTPDVAAMSGDSIALLTSTNAYEFYSDGSQGIEGGTSLSSPLWMGMWARVQAAAPKGGLGFADPSFYAIGTGKKGSYSRDFYDITVGTNGLYLAGPGWDYTTGWGVPDVTNLIRDLDGKLAPTSNILPPAPPAPKAPVLPCGVLWMNPPHTATDALGNSDPQLTLVSGSIQDEGGTLAVKLTVQDLSQTLPVGAATESWYMTWTYKGTEYYASALISIVPGSQPSFEDGYHDSQGYHGVHADTGSFGSGPNGVVEIDVPKTNVGSPPAQAVLVQPAGATYTGYGVPPNASGVYLVGQLQVDTGGPTNDFVVGSRCAQTLSSVQGVHRTQRQSTAAGGPLAQTGLLPIGVLAGLLLLLLGTGMAVRYRRSG